MAVKRIATALLAGLLLALLAGGKASGTAATRALFAPASLRLPAASRSDLPPWRERHIWHPAHALPAPHVTEKASSAGEALAELFFAKSDHDRIF